LQVSEGQLVKWQQASAKFLAERAVQEASQKQALQATLAKAAVKALQENQQLADQGDVYGQLRMGERYLTGDGVEKDLVRARKYLQLAADQGSPSAADDLKNLQGK
jgi:TPR repeat protein